MSEFVGIASVYLVSGTEHISTGDVQHPSYLFEGRVMNWGNIDRSIPILPGLVQISDASIRIADTDRKWRDLLSANDPRNAQVDIRLIELGASETAAPLVYSGMVDKFRALPTAEIELKLKDRLFSWIDELIPALVLPQFFPDSTIDPRDVEGFIPFVNGGCISSTAHPEGVIPIPHIGTVTNDAGTVDVWGLSATPITDFAVYRRERITVNKSSSASGASDLEWQVVDPAEYTTVEFPVTCFGVDMTQTYLQFNEVQPDGTELRADIVGIKFRGEFGPLPPVEGAPLVNPIDFFINMMYFVMRKAGVPVDVLDVDGIAALRNRFEELLYTCEGAITKRMTIREWLGQFLPSFNLDMYVNKQGKISLGFIEDADPARPVFSEVDVDDRPALILKETFTEDSPAKVAKQILYHYQYHNATEQFEASTTVPEDASDVEVEQDELNEYFIREAGMAKAIATLRLPFLSSGSYLQEFKVPAPEAINDLELGKIIGITHSMGLPVGGYVNQPVKVYGLTLDLNTLTYTVRTVVRVAEVTPVEATA